MRFGWKRQLKDTRDRVLTFTRKFAAALPERIDLGPYMPYPDDQGDLGSCGPSSAWENLCYDLLVERKVFVPPSRLFIYYTTRSLMGTITEDSGVDNRTMLKALNKFGACSEKKWPYDVSKFTRKPTADCFKLALNNRIMNYVSILQDEIAMKVSLASGHPFIFGFDVYENMMSSLVERTGVVPMPSGKQIGGHDVLIFGYDDAKQRFKFRNHWTDSFGAWWGDHGDGYIPYKYALDAQLSGDFWAINVF